MRNHFDDEWAHQKCPAVVPGIRGRRRRAHVAIMGSEIAGGGVRRLRLLKSRFQAKCTPPGMKKTRQNNNLEPWALLRSESRL